MNKNIRRKTPKAQAPNNHIIAPDEFIAPEMNVARDDCAHARLQESLDQLPSDGYPTPFVACAPGCNCPACNNLRRQRGFSEGLDER